MNGRSEVSKRERRDNLPKTKQKENPEPPSCLESAVLFKGDNSQEVIDNDHELSVSESERRNTECKVAAEPSKFSKDLHNRYMSRQKANTKTHDGVLSDYAYLQNSTTNTHYNLSSDINSKSSTIHRFSNQGNDLPSPDDHLKSSRSIPLEEPAISNISSPERKIKLSTKATLMLKSNKFKLHPIKHQNPDSDRTLPRELDSGVSDTRVYFQEHFKNKLEISNPPAGEITSVTTHKAYDNESKKMNSDAVNTMHNKKKEDSGKVTDNNAGKEYIARDSSPAKNGDQMSKQSELKDEEVGRKLTVKDGKTVLGSTTTLSSNTESSDEADDVFNVVLRVRPLNSQERGRRDNPVIEYPGDSQVAVSTLGSKRNFKFNAVFEPNASQGDVFENCGIKKLVEAALNGFTCTTFAFGQTGSGKTHTMTGPPAQFYTDGVTPDPRSYGIIQRSFKYLFQLLTQQATPKVIRASYLEIYNEQVIDLLNNSHGRYLSVRWSKNKGFYVQNLFTIVCQTADDLMAVLDEGLQNRQNGSHGLNEFSSRSHSVLTVSIDSERRLDPEDDNLYITNKGKLSFVDLAGSEKVKDSGTGGPGIMESNSINKSLLVLGNCISHLGDSKRRLGHIPYRDSKLTKLLSDSLAGNGITLMIACITPSSANVTETVNTLRYASRAKRIKTKPTVKMDPRETLIVTLKREIRILRQENHYLRQQLDFPAKPKGQLQKENDEQFLKFMKQQQQKESGLYEMLQEYMVENEALRSENSQLHTVKDSMRRDQQALHDENDSLSQRVEQLERLMPQLTGIWQATPHQRTNGFNQWDLSPRGPLPNMGYTSPSHRPGIRANDLPSGVGRFKLASPVTQSQPTRPPHRLTDHVSYPAPRPVDYTEANGHIDSHMSPRHTSVGKTAVISPKHKERQPPLSQTELIRGMNEKLLQEVMQLDGEIQQHTRTANVAKNTSKDFYR